MKTNFLFLMLCGAVAISPLTVLAQDSKTSDVSESDILSEYELDELQQLYLSITPDMSYTDASELILGYELPYSEEKYNGSRVFQVALTEACTDQNYKKESGDYLEITYNYPKDENSANDNLEKYILGSCVYVPEDGPTLINLLDGYYFSFNKPGNYIEENGKALSNSSNPMTKEEQLLYFFTHS